MALKEVRTLQLFAVQLFHRMCREHLARASADVRTFGVGSPALRGSGSCRGEVGVSQVTEPSSSRAPRSNTPPIPPASRPITTSAVLPSGYWVPWAIGRGDFRSRCSPAHALAYLRFDDEVTRAAARLTTGLSGSTLARRDLHPLDDKQNFTNSSHLAPF